MRETFQHNVRKYSRKMADIDFIFGHKNYTLHGKGTRKFLINTKDNTLVFYCNRKTAITS